MSNHYAIHLETNIECQLQLKHKSTHPFFFFLTQCVLLGHRSMAFAPCTPLAETLFASIPRDFFLSG